MYLGNRIGIFGTLLAFVGGCSGLASDEDTYNTVILSSLAGGSGGTTEPGNGGDGDGVPPDVSQDPNWSCLEAPVKPADRDPARVQYRVVIVDFDSQTANLAPVPDLNIVVCTNAACDPPLPTCPAGATVTPTQPCFTQSTPLPVPYVVQLDLPWRLENASLRLTAPNYVEMNYIFGGPMIGPPEGGSLVVGLPIPVLRESARNSAYQDCQGTPVEPDRGVLAVRTLSCKRDPTPIAPGIFTGSRAASVSVEALPQPPPPACAWAVANDNVFSPNSLKTDARGVAGILNTDVGALVVRAKAPMGIVYPTTPPAFRVRAGVITLAELRDGLGVWGQ